MISDGTGYPPRVKRKGLIAGALVVALLLAVPLGAWLSRNLIATSMARDQLAARGLSCDDRFAVSLSATFGQAVIGPTRCTREGGVVGAIELLGDVTVELDGTEPSSVHADSLRLVLRDTNVRGGSSWAAPLRRLELEQHVAALVKSLSELSSMDLPPSTATQVEIVRGSSPLATATGLSLTPGVELSLAADRIHFSTGPMGVGQLDLTRVTGTATRPQVSLRGRADARAGVGILTMGRGGPFGLDATALDTASPQFHLTGDF